MDDTKIIYHIDDEETPYLVKLAVLPNAVTLGDFKNALNRPNYKVVKEEITDENAKLPCFNGKVISWLVSADSSTKSDNHSNGTGENHLVNQNKITLNKTENSHGTSKMFDVSNEQEHAVGTTGHGLDECDTCAETDSVNSGDRLPPLKNFHNYKHGSKLAKLGQRIQNYETASSSMMSSDLESTSFFDSEDDSSRFSTATGTTMSSAKYGRHKRQRRPMRILPARRTSEDATSFSSVTDSTMSLNIITVTLNMDSVNFLGISIVGQSNKAGDGGIYVGSIMRGGAVAQDGRIEPGDMILEVNRISFEDMSNDEAVRVLREEVQKPGPITLVVAKCWDPSPKNYFTIPRQEPVRPIDPRAWVLHTNAMTGQIAHPGMEAGNPNGVPFVGSSGSVVNHSMLMMPGSYVGMGGNPVISNLPQFHPSALGSLPSSSNITNKSLAEGAVVDGMPTVGTNLVFDGFRSVGKASGPGSVKTGSRSGGETTVDQKTAHHSLMSGIHNHSDSTNGNSSTSLTVATDMASVVHDMLLPDSGLEIHDRTWLKITIPNAFIGSDLVDWLYTHVDGFADRRDARRYASNLLKYGYIRHTVNKNTFSEQCYYTFGDLATTLSQLNFDEVDSVSEIGLNAISSNPGGHQLMPPHMYPTSMTPGGGVQSESVGPTSSVFINSKNANTNATSNNANLNNVTNDTSANNMLIAHADTAPYPYPVPMFYQMNANNSTGIEANAFVQRNLMGLNNQPQSSMDPLSKTTIPPSSNLHGQVQLDQTAFSYSNNNNNNNNNNTNNHNSCPINPNSQPSQHLMQMHPPSYQLIQQPAQFKSQKLNCPLSLSSSHSSSSSTSSSASSSSSTRSSHKREVVGGPSVPTLQSATAKNGNFESFDLKNQPVLHKQSNQRRIDPSSVHSLSGTSSASSASRQNGTGASATGSGSGSLAAPCYFSNKILASKSELLDPVNHPARSPAKQQQQHQPVHVSGEAGCQAFGLMNSKNAAV